jgi:hypothetical protein
MTRDELIKQHPDYKKWLPEWNFYVASYFGGKFYRDGNYLSQHPFESATNYARRKQTAYFYNYCAPIIDIMVAQLYQESPRRDYGSLSPNPVPSRVPETLFDSFWWNVDYEGTSWTQFIRDTQRFASVYGRVAIVVDKPKLLAQTQAEEKEIDIRPYLNRVTPENLTDWKYARQSNGRVALEMIKIREYKHEEIEHYRIWTREGWELWETSSKSNHDVNLLDSGVHSLNEVPVVILYNKRTGMKMLGLSDLKDISDINKNIYYLCSDAKEIIENTAFPMLAAPYEKGSLGDEQIVGPRNVWQFDPDNANAKPFWLEPPHSSLTEIREWVQQDAAEIARIALMGGLRNISASTQPWTGVAIQMQGQQLEAALVEKAENAEQAELDILNLWAKWQGEKFDGEIEYSKKFNVRDTSIILQSAVTALSANIMSKTFERERQKLVVDALLPEADESIKKQMREEIDESEVQPLDNKDAGERGATGAKTQYGLSAGVGNDNADMGRGA